jgi:hypothetical protein
MLLAAGRIKLPAGRQGAEMVMGFMGGILGGLAASRSSAHHLAALKGWQKQERRIFFQAYQTARSCRAMLAGSFGRALVGRASCWHLPSLSRHPGRGWPGGAAVSPPSMTAGYDHIVLCLLLASGLGLSGPAVVRALVIFGH